MKEKTKAKYFGMHPMFAPPVSGKMEGQNILFCSGNAKEEEEFFQEIFTKDGAICLSATAEEHDTLMTIVQGLSHFLDITFIKTLSETSIPVEKIFASRSPAYALKMMLAGRTLYQDANLYGNIQIQNPKNIETLEKFFAVSHELFEVIQQKDLQKFEEIFDGEKKYLGEYALRSQQESDKIIDFLASNILKKSLKNTPEKNSSEEKKELSLLESQKKRTFHQEEVQSIGILGPKNTFSYIAAEKFFGDTEDILLFPSIPALFSAYEKGKISQVFVPIENMLHGSVVETIDGISNSNLQINQIFEMKISPSLFIPKGLKKEQITQIFSHPQALAQCSEFLEKYFPEVEYIPLHSTAGGVEKILETPFSAAIAAPQLAKKFPVEELYQNIANTNKNATRFASLLPENRENNLSPKITENNKNSPSALYEGGISFLFDKDSPGSLESVLHLFSSKKINLTKIESRPTGEEFGQYTFFVTYSGKLSPSEKSDFFAELSQKVSSFRFLGEFEIIRE
jgi:prephenate dehydratase